MPLHTIYSEHVVHVFKEQIDLCLLSPAYLLKKEGAESA